MKETIERGIHPPPDGWIENSFYIVDVVVDSISPIVKAILFTGQLNANSQPAEKSLLFNAEFGKIYSAGIVHYMKPVALLNIDAVNIKVFNSDDFPSEKVEELARDIRASQEEQTAKEEGSKTDWKENLL